ncbi:hypothetical protein [Streptomyces anulatus]|uniref:hypothetical protein n=1 Tax=Streptomyces anulatus TaxID=1892 RepID=UPI003867AA98|nr:hypothetical protein OG238_00155 [Streptomyces anulatus]WST90424.1 hypothetical protein OG238_41375 [Streptomyces anulatus]
MYQLQRPVALGTDGREVTVPAAAGALAGGVDEVEFVDNLVPGVEERLVALEYLVVKCCFLLETEGVAAADKVSAEPLRDRWRLYALTPAAGWGWC